ncbi:MAG: EAL domain-containing protein [Pararhodobacter sp.]
MTPWLGGAFVGLAIAAMHYTGMMGYNVNGTVTWHVPVLITSILLSVIFSGAALDRAMQRRDRRDMRANWTATGMFAAAIVLLHFTGMAAFQVAPLGTDTGVTDPGAIVALALAVAGVGFLILGAGTASYMIEQSVRSDSYERLRRMAATDSLTGLPNRLSFNHHLDTELRRANMGGDQVALINIDLDRFKEINDLHGHAAGDAVLIALAKRLSDDLREGEFVARLGGDEFAAIKRIDSAADLEDFLARLESHLHDAMQIGELGLKPGASLGVAVYPDDASDKLTLIGNADLAMYRAKLSTGTPVAFYDPSMDEAVRIRKTLANDLRLAIERDELDLHFQVQLSVLTGEIRGYEALARWDHPVRGNISPEEFIPIAEEHGLILKLGEWVLRRACERASRWEPPYRVSVNVSPLQFAHADLPKLVLEILLEAGLPAHRLEIELTESAIFADKERSLHMLRQIKAMGVTIALDDFGTGYSSLETLRAFPFDKIKLDRSFVEHLDTNPQTAAMVRAILALGRSLNIPVLAEGIEKAEQMAVLKLEGCDEVQGYLFGRPQPIGEIVEAGHITLKAEAPAPLADARGPRPGEGEPEIFGPPLKSVRG